MDEINYRQINQRIMTDFLYCTHMGCTYIQMQIKAFLLFPSYYYTVVTIPRDSRNKFFLKKRERIGNRGIRR